MSASARPLPSKWEERTVAEGRDQTNASRWRGVAYRNPACIASLLRLLLIRAAHSSPTRGAAVRASTAPTARAHALVPPLVYRIPSLPVAPLGSPSARLLTSSPPHRPDMVSTPSPPVRRPGSSRSHSPAAVRSLLPPSLPRPASRHIPPSCGEALPLMIHERSVPVVHGRTPTTRARAATRVVVIASRAPRFLLLYSRFFSETPSSSCSASRPHTERPMTRPLPCIHADRAGRTARGARLRPPLRRAGHER
ncbi:hypothetical protein DFH09DRAFT_1328120 [Mycena vulgaris]|nr:hypothetical protein DFH09DRAFT_1328120 [Mycena vulgaris]